jgi:DegV family protein with EDD domain
MNSQRIAILTDSGTNTPREFCAAHDIRIVPLTINYRDGSFQSEVNITTPEVIERFATEIPSTSLPSPKTIQEVFDQARASGYERAVFVSISSGLSATNHTVHMVANEQQDFPVTIIDTKSIGIAAGMVTMNAALMVEAGVPFEELEPRLTELSAHTGVYFAVEELSYLRKGGRISEATYRLGSALNIKPIFDTNEQGVYRTVHKCRGWQKALKAEVDLVAKRARSEEQVIAAICCSEQDAPFDQLEAELREKIPNLVYVLRSGVSPDLIVHTGPTVVGLGVQVVTPEMLAWIKTQQ